VVRSAVLLVALGVGTFGCARLEQARTVPSLPLAEPPQTFSMKGPAPPPTLAGEGPVVVVFFATWCELSSHKLKTVRRATEEVSGASLLLVALDDERTQHHVPGFLREHGIAEAPVVNGLAHLEFLERYNPESVIPFVLVVGADGVPLDSQVGLRSGDGQRLEDSLRLAFYEEARSMDLVD
jgi:hypothetical protein